MNKIFLNKQAEIPSPQIPDQDPGEPEQFWWKPLEQQARVNKHSTAEQSHRSSPPAEQPAGLRAWVCTWGLNTGSCGSQHGTQTPPEGTVNLYGDTASALLRFHSGLHCLAEGRAPASQGMPGKTTLSHVSCCHPTAHTAPSPRSMWHTCFVFLASVQTDFCTATRHKSVSLRRGLSDLGYTQLMSPF